MGSGVSSCAHTAGDQARTAQTRRLNKAMDTDTLLMLVLYKLRSFLTSFALHGAYGVLFYYERGDYARMFCWAIRITDGQNALAGAVNGVR
jgi:hypothetical protein